MTELRWNQIPDDPDAPGPPTWQASGDRHVYLLAGTSDSSLVLTARPNPAPRR